MPKFDQNFCVFLEYSGIFQIPKKDQTGLQGNIFEIFLEYSILQNNYIFVVMDFFWNIPFCVFSYSMEYFAESIFQKLKKNVVMRGVKFNQAF